MRPRAALCTLSRVFMTGSTPPVSLRGPTSSPPPPVDPRSLCSLLAQGQQAPAGVTVLPLPWPSPMTSPGAFRSPPPCPVCFAGPAGFPTVWPKYSEFLGDCQVKYQHIEWTDAHVHDMLGPPGPDVDMPKLTLERRRLTRVHSLGAKHAQEEAGVGYLALSSRDSRGLVSTTTSHAHPTPSTAPASTSEG